MLTPEYRARITLDRFHRDCLCEHEAALVADAIREAVAEALAAVALPPVAHVHGSGCINTYPDCGE